MTTSCLSKTVVFFERAPYMSVELLDLLERYEVSCYDASDSTALLELDWNIAKWSSKPIITTASNDQCVEQMLADEEYCHAFGPCGKGASALMFYMTRKMEDLLTAARVPILLPSFKLQNRLGDKLNLETMCDDLGIVTNRSLRFVGLGEPKEVFARCSAALGIPFIVQGPSGVSGEDTSIVHDLRDLQSAARRAPRSVRIAKFIPRSIPISTHVCVTRTTIIVRGPYLQLVGFSELTSNPFQFAGNDTNQSIIRPEVGASARIMSHQIGSYARAGGYLGILGVDYLWDQDEGIVYPQEVNARLIGLTRLITGIQKDQNLIPDILRHLATFGVSNFTKRVVSMRDAEVDLSRHNYVQVLIYNNEPRQRTIRSCISPSIYIRRGGKLSLARKSLFIQDMRQGEVLITFCAPRKRVIAPNDLIARLVLKDSALEDGEYALKPPVRELVSTIRDMTLFDH